jgi:hypothetical protein
LLSSIEERVGFFFSVSFIDSGESIRISLDGESMISSAFEDVDGVIE